MANQVYKYSEPQYFDGSTTQLTVDVSAVMADAREAIWSLYAPDSTELIGALTVVDAAHVQININPAPAEGEYMLVGLA